MLLALEEARRAAERGEVPVGAVIVAPDGTVIARAGNRTRELADPTAHAEMLVIREACRKSGSERLTEHSIKFARAEGAAAVPRSIGAGDDSTAIVLDPSAPAGGLRRPAVIAAGTAGGLGTLLFLLVRYLFGL